MTVEGADPIHLNINFFKVLFLTVLLTFMVEVEAVVVVVKAEVVVVVVVVG